ncbi:bacterioferritin-associated ferredoxin [Mycobacterium tuberculosis]|nr:bacterioferritin-associated ferredoxin [Mycobacterium tuberculosis]
MPNLNKGNLSPGSGAPSRFQPHGRSPTGMYVCICNAITEDDVHGCMASGCATAKAVKAACGFKPGCGMCTKRIYTMVSQYRTANELADALTGGPRPLMPAPSPEPAAPAAPAAPVAADLDAEGAAPPTAA